MCPAPSIRPLTVVVAPDSFKGSLTSVEVARALAAGWSRARPADTLLVAPLADGGEGTLAAIHEAGGWGWRIATVSDPIGRPAAARWLLSKAGDEAVVELAEASGLSRLGSAERDPIGATTRGTGELILAALDAGARRIVLGIGGSATTDGGAGLAFALGATDDGRRVALEGLAPRLGDVELEVACDVTNPLLGPSGAAATYGPQKGATPEDVALLDAHLAAWADRLEAATGRHERDTHGAGAAGGVGFALLCLQERFRSFALVPGVEVVMAATCFDEKLAAADLVLTGEGRIDAQTGFGKTVLGVARRAAAAGVACIAVGGTVEDEGRVALGAVGASAVPVWETAVPLDVAMAAGPTPLVRCGERLARSAGAGGIVVR